MPFNRISSRLFFALTAVAIAFHASAALEISRDVSIVDEFGGSLTLITIGSRDMAGAENTTTATFDGFRPNPDGRSFEGEVVRHRVRSERMIENVYDGTLEIRVPARGDREARVKTLAFESLTVTRDGTGPVLGGSVSFNGKTRAASELPRPAARALAYALRFFAYA